MTQPISSPKLAPRLRLPVRGAWKRLYGGDARTTMLKKAFDPDNLQKKLVYGLYGPQESGKTSAAFAIADHFGLNLVIPNTAASEEPPIEVTGKSLVLIDPFDAYNTKEINTFIMAYHKRCTIIIVAREVQSLQKLPIDILVALKHPNQNGIMIYIQKMLVDYKHGLEQEDFAEISHVLSGLSYPQINNIIVDAVLARLARDENIDKAAFIEAVETFKIIKGKYK